MSREVLTLNRTWHQNIRAHVRQTERQDQACSGRELSELRPYAGNRGWYHLNMCKSLGSI